MPDETQGDDWPNGGGGGAGDAAAALAAAQAAQADVDAAQAALAEISQDLLNMAGTIVSPTVVGSFQMPSSEAHDIYVSGDYAYLPSAGGQFWVVDISVPTAPKLAGQLVGYDATIDGPYAVWVSGRYAYVTGQFSDNLTVIDVSDPHLPVKVAQLTDATNLNGAIDVVVVGRYAYVTCQDGDRFTVVDIADPLLPTVAASITHATNLNGALGLAIQGRYAYVSASESARLTVVDISNPLVPVIAGSVADPSNQQGSYVDVKGRYVYLERGSTSGWLAIYDVVNPTAPVFVAKTAIADSAPLGVKVAGGYAFIPTQASHELLIYDVRDPTVAPVFLTTVQDDEALFHAFCVHVSGRYAYVSASGNGFFAVVDLVGDGGTEAARSIGTLQADEVDVAGDLDVAGIANVGTGLNVGPGGLATSAAIAGHTVSARGKLGAVAASRYAGATASGAPASGTFLVGDFIVDQAGKIWVCTGAGTPGTWVDAGGGVGYTDGQAIDAVETLADAKGDLLAGTAADTLARLAVGANDRLLIADSTQATGLRWATPAEVRTALDVPTNAAAVLDAIIDAKGDLLAGTAADTIARLAVGTDGQVLTADAASTPGVKWATAAGGGSGWPILNKKSGKFYLSNYAAAAVGQVANAGYMVLYPVHLPAVTLNRIGVEVQTGAASSAMRLGIYNDDGSGYPGTLLLDAGTVSSTASATVATITISQVIATAGLYWFAAVAQGGSPTLWGTEVGGSKIPIPFDAMPFAGHTTFLPYQASVTGALPNPVVVAGSLGGVNPRIHYRIA